jgi:hypothetical protein
MPKPARQSRRKMRGTRPRRRLHVRPRAGDALPLGERGHSRRRSRFAGRRLGRCLLPAPPLPEEGRPSFTKWLHPREAAGESSTHASLVVARARERMNASSRACEPGRASCERAREARCEHPRPRDAAREARDQRGASWDQTSRAREPARAS